MITTVTTVTTVTTLAAMGFTTTIVIAAIGSLIAFLVTKELVSANHSGSLGRMAKFVNVGIWPLAIVCGVCVAIKVVGVLA